MIPHTMLKEDCLPGGADQGLHVIADLVGGLKKNTRAALGLGGSHLPVLVCRTRRRGFLIYPYLSAGKMLPMERV